MAYPTAPGFRDIGSTTMIYHPTLYAPKLLIKFYARTVFGAISNTDYEGQISKMGQEVKIRTLPDITIRDYRKGQTLVNEQPTSTATNLLIDKGKYWAFVDDDVDQKQTDIKDYVEQWTGDAAEQLAITIDTGILGDIYSSANASNQGATAGAISSNINLGVSGTPLALTKANILEKIVDCGQVLDEQNVPEMGRWIVLPAWACAMIKKSDLKDASLAGDGTSVIRNGRVGMIDRFTIYMSNNLTNTTDGANEVANCIFGTNHALTFASQLTKNESLRNPNGFGTLYRGLQVYGYKVVKPEALGWLYAYQG